MSMMLRNTLPAEKSKITHSVIGGRKEMLSSSSGSMENSASRVKVVRERTMLLSWLPMLTLKGSAAGYETMPQQGQEKTCSPVMGLFRYSMELSFTNIDS